jgi:hypothetical protein
MQCRNSVNSSAEGIPWNKAAVMVRELIIKVLWCKGLQNVQQDIEEVKSQIKKPMQRIQIHNHFLVRMHRRTVHYIFILTLTAGTYLFDTSNIITSITCYLEPIPGPYQFVYPLPSYTFPLACHLSHPFGTSYTLPIHSCSLTWFGILLGD